MNDVTELVYFPRSYKCIVFYVCGVYSFTKLSLSRGCTSGVFTLALLNSGMFLDTSSMQTYLDAVYLGRNTYLYRQLQPCPASRIVVSV